ncbi:HAD family phosphatase [Gangjinia marincola]|uniref:HAD family phosphatase n=1 Tax=Gangjinia marincola TaxID=578463 RepID=A0ABP3XRB7_9FLAO
MIRNLVFDFGDVFINLDKTATINSFREAGIDNLPPHLEQLNIAFEKGEYSHEQFLEAYHNYFDVSKEEIVHHWNAILKEFPAYRLDFLRQLRTEGKFKLILLSNTNQIHIDYIKKHVSFYPEFKHSFDGFYLSHEINLRKPDLEIYEYVLEQHKMKPTETLFIDDTLENTVAAEKLGIHTWNINPATQDVVDLFAIKKELF